MFVQRNSHVNFRVFGGDSVAAVFLNSCYNVVFFTVKVSKRIHVRLDGSDYFNLILSVIRQNVSQ